MGSRRVGSSGFGSSSLALSNLRAAVIVIVVAFHACLAYLAHAPAPGRAFDRPPYAWQAFPIVDTQHWLGFDLFCAWQDVSLMSVMFLLSGVFAAGSLRRKGGLTYISDRFWRIGLPFLLAVALLSPLSYYPAYLIRASDASVVDYWWQWFSLPFWPSGPEWFLWLLLVVNVLVAVLYLAMPRSIVFFDRLAVWGARRPLAFFVFLTAASACAYVPLALVFTPWSWSALGPFSLQLARPALYLVFFLAGFAFGCHGLDRGLLACDGALARHWRVWLAAALGGFAAWAGCTSLTLPEWSRAGITAQFAATLAFPLACATGSLFLVALSLRFAARLRLWIVDSLSANAYAIYLLHYVFVVWLQYALLGSDLFVGAKLVLVLVGALIMSWVSSLALRTAAVPHIIAVKRAFLPQPR